MVLVILPGVILIFWFVVLYNRIVKGKQSVTESWSDIDVQLKRRHDLIPQLVSMVTAYASYETNLLSQISALREQSIALSIHNLPEIAVLEGDLQSKISALIARAETYPDLQADAQFLKLQQELLTTEDQIASARRIYNGNVANYNSTISSFPAKEVAGLIRAEPAAFFQSDS